MLVPRDLNKCAVGQCKYVFVTAPDGGIINDPILLRLDENHFWISVADSDVLLWVMGVACNSGLDVTIDEPDIGPLQIQGPKSKEVVVDLFGESALEIPYYYLREYELGGLDVIVSRTGYTAELGFEIYVRDAGRNGVKVWEIVLEAGKPHGLTVIGPCLWGALFSSACKSARCARRTRFLAPHTGRAPSRNRRRRPSGSRSHV